MGNTTAETAGSTTTRCGYNRAGELCRKGPNVVPLLGQAYPATPSGSTTVNRDAAGNSLGTTADPYTVNDRNQVTNIDGTAKTYHDQGNDLRATNGSTREVAGPLGIVAQINGSTAATLLRDPSGTILSSRTSAGVQNYVTEPSGNTFLLTSFQRHGKRRLQLRPLRQDRQLRHRCRSEPAGPNRQIPTGSGGAAQGWPVYGG